MTGSGLAPHGAGCVCPGDSAVRALENTRRGLQNEWTVPRSEGRDSEMPEAAGPSDSPRRQSVLEVCERVLARGPTERRVALAAACGGNIELRWKVERLVAGRDGQGSGRLAKTFKEGLDRAVRGARIGNYTLQNTLGSGSTGTVYKATRDGTARIVALKILRLGLRSERAVQRFHFETRRLAALRHPGIAQLVEVGTHIESDGIATPFVAMEYVHNARSLLSYADAEQLSVTARLELMCRACDAVHYGHQKGVLHRDIKPANMLVDAAGCLKLVDFGLSRAIGAHESVASLAAEPDTVLRVLPYLSPERLDIDSRRVDTRSDVYSLGVVLYELLCGRRPHDLSDVPLFRAQQILRTATPTAPLAAAPDMDPALEPIVLRALERDPDQRYGSAARCAVAIRRYLEWQVRTPETVGTQWHDSHGSVALDEVNDALGSGRITASRRRFSGLALVSVAAAVAIVLISLVGWGYATEGRNQARRADAVKAALLEVMSLGKPERLGRQARLADALTVVERNLERSWDGPDDEYVVVMATLGEVCHDVGLWQAGVRASEAALEAARRSPNIPARDRGRAFSAFGLNLLALSRPKEALSAFETSERLFLASVGATAHDTLEAGRNAARALTALGRHEESEARLSALVDAVRPADGKHSREAIATLDTLSRLYAIMNKPDLALEVGEERAQLIEMRELREGSGYPEMHHHQAQLLFAHGRCSEAVQEQRTALGIWREVLGSENDNTRSAIANLGVYLTASGLLAEGEELLRESLAQARAAGNPEELARQLAHLGWNLVHQERDDEAEPLIDEVLSSAMATSRHPEPVMHMALRCKGRLLARRGDSEAAEPLLRRAVDELPVFEPDGGLRRVETLGWYVDLLEGLGRHAEAVRRGRELSMHR